MKVYVVWENGEIRVFASRDAAEAAIEPSAREHFKRLCDPDDDWPGAPGGRLWRSAHYRKMGWQVYWEQARKQVDEYEVEGVA